MIRHSTAHLSPLLRVSAGALLLFAVVVAAGTSGPRPGVEVVGQIAAAETPSLDPRQPLPAEAAAWVDTTLASMSLEDRAGQVLMVRAFGEYYPADASQRAELVDLVQQLGLGGVVLFRSQAYEAAALLHDLQRAAAAASHLPLLVAADFEWGAEFRIDGAVPYPTAMAVGATFDPAAAEWMGTASARDALALGIHWILAPVADVNINPGNPVINVRAFGEEAEHVGQMAAAFVRGAQAGGVLATAKHFPGHGDTAVDSHIALPVLAHDSERLQSVELRPFRSTIEAGVASIMTAHLAVPALTADTSLPATLSGAVLTQLLREELGFTGLVATDAMEMGGISRRWWSGEAAVEALAAGADVVLLPPQPRAVHAAVVRAVRRGDLPAERLEDAVRRVLAAKARLGLTHGVAAPALPDLAERFAPESDVAKAQHVADAAVTLLRDRDAMLPLDARRWQDVAVIGISDSDEPAPTGALVTALREPLASVRAYSIDGRTRGDEAAAIVAAASRARTVVLAVRVRVRTSSGSIALPTRQAEYARMLAQLRTPTIVVALGSPYTVAAFPEASTALAVYGWSEPLQRAAARAIVGAIPLGGRLPVSVPGLYAVGDGIVRPRLDATLRPPDEGVAVADLNSARQALQASVEAGAFPGAVWAVAHRGRLLALESAGRLSVAAEAPAMPVDALFDLASVTKVVGTTTAAMLAVESDALRLDYPVHALVPEFVGEGKDAVTIRHLLTHTSGLPGYIEMFRDFDPADAGPEVRQAILQRVMATPLQSTPGERFEYSDLGVILLGEVLDRAFGEPFEAVVQRRVFEPIGMRDTRWNPPPSELHRIPPTEQDAWRGRLVQGEVHDENAFAMGGMAPHAGLFSTGHDLAVFGQMLLNLGIYDHDRVLQRATIEAWRRRQSDASSRALGWDTAADSERWGMFSPQAYGHTGFTGTSLWIDPARDLVVVLLTNRVNPTRDNSRHIEARLQFHRAVVEAIDGGPAGR